MDDKTKNKILNPFNLLAFALAILSLLFLHNGPHIYVMINSPDCMYCKIYEYGPFLYSLHGIHNDLCTLVSISDYS